MKGKIIVLIVLIILAGISSVTVLNIDGYFDSNKNENKILSVEQPVAASTTITQNTTEVKNPVVAKKVTPVKKKSKATKKTTKKKVVKKKKSSVNPAPPVITLDTAPHSAKNKYN